MAQPPEFVSPPVGTGADDPVDRGAEPPGEVPGLLGRVPRLGLWAWSFVGFVVAAIIVCTALGTVSEILLPMTFAAVLAVCFRPLVHKLERRRMKPSLASGLIVLGLLFAVTGVAVATVRGVVDQTDEIDASADKAIDKAAEQTDALGIDKDALTSAREDIEGAGPSLASGVLTGLVSGFSTLIAIASGVILGALIMFYLLKDGSHLRRSVMDEVDTAYRAELDDFVGDSCRILRDYGRGRSVMSAIVSAFIGLVALLMGLPLVFTIVVVNFIGGYIPYIGAFLGGGLAVIIALGDGGIPQAAIMLIAVLASNLILENFVEPKVMGRTLDIHPLVVLVVTALGGLLGGIVGLILAVPAWVIASDAISRARRGGWIQEVADFAEPAVKQMLDSPRDHSA